MDAEHTRQNSEAATQKNDNRGAAIMNSVLGRIMNSPTTGSELNIVQRLVNESVRKDSKISKMNVKHTRQNSEAATQKNDNREKNV